MGREFTNALSQTPLWKFALSVYDRHQTELLSWQTHYRANVNELIALAYCRKHNLTMMKNHAAEDAKAIALLIERVRSVRVAAKGSGLYEPAKALELQLEGLHLMCLADTFSPSDDAPNYEMYEKVWRIKKGAIAPFIKTLLS